MASFIAEQINDVFLNVNNDDSINSVRKLRSKNPQDNDDQLVNKIIQRKCMQAGAVGAVTSGSAIIPSIGTVAALTFGVAVDMKMTFKIQCELVLEIAAAYNRAVEKRELQNIILTVTGISAGTQLAVETIGQRIATKVTTKFAEKSITKAIPFIGVAVTGGSNIVTTFIIGRRAQAYLKLGPAEMLDWQESVRAITGVNEKEIVDWLRDSTEASFKLISDCSKLTKSTIAMASQESRTAVVVFSKRASEAIQSTGKKIVRDVSNFGQNESEENELRPGILGAFFSILQPDKKGDNNLQSFTNNEIVIIAEGLNDAEIEDEIIIGIVGANDEIEDIESTRKWNINKVLDLFSWDHALWVTSNGRKADIEQVKDLYQSESKAQVIITGDEKGFLFNAGRLFRGRQ